MRIEMLPATVTLGCDGFAVSTINVRHQNYILHEGQDQAPFHIGGGAANLSMIEDEELQKAASALLVQVRRVLRESAGLEKSDLRLVDKPEEDDDEPL